MKYRIKIIIYKTGRKEYYAQKKYFFGWIGLYQDGEEMGGGWCNDRNDALKRIDLNYSGNSKKQIVEFEYINKP
jgi:hypothetical protein